MHVFLEFEDVRIGTVGVSVSLLFNEEKKWKGRIMKVFIRWSRVRSR